MMKSGRVMLVVIQTKNGPVLLMSYRQHVLTSTGSQLGGLTELD